VGWLLLFIMNNNVVQNNLNFAAYKNDYILFHYT